MNINQFKNGGGNQFPPMSAGTYPAVCSDVIGIGTQSTEYNGEHTTQNQLILLFDFPTETIKIDGQQKPRCLSDGKLNVTGHDVWERTLKLRYSTIARSRRRKENGCCQLLRVLQVRQCRCCMGERW